MTIVVLYEETWIYYGYYQLYKYSDEKETKMVGHISQSRPLRRSGAGDDNNAPFRFRAPT